MSDEQNKEEKDVWMELLKQYPIDELVKFSEFNIQEKLMNNAWTVQEYIGHLEKERDNLERVIELRDKITGKRYDYYRFGFSKELKQSEIEKFYIPQDELVLKANAIVRKQQYRVNFFAMCVKSLDKLQWNMKSFLESQRLGM